MAASTTSIMVFKTNINSKDYSGQVALALEEFGEEINWNLDLEDVDKILRVECDSDRIGPEEIIQKMKEADFYCEELQD